MVTTNALAYYCNKQVTAVIALLKLAQNLSQASSRSTLKLLNSRQ
jgi:hypothetical protein